MDIVDWLVGPLVGAVLGVIATRVTDRWRAAASDFELWYTVRSNDISSAAAAELKVTHLTYLVDGVPVETPHVVDVEVWNAGAKDIQKTMFSEGQPFVLSLGAPVVAFIGSHSFGDDGARLSSESQGTVALEPSLLRRGMLQQLRFVTAGAPKPSWSGVIADLNLFNLDSEVAVPTVWSRVVRVVSILLMLVLPASLLLALIPELREAIRSVGLGVFAPVVSGSLVLGLILLTFGGGPSRQVQRALRTRNRSRTQARARDAAALPDGR